MLLDGVRKGVGRETQMEDMRFFVGATFGCGSGHRDTSPDGAFLFWSAEAVLANQ